MRYLLFVTFVCCLQSLAGQTGTLQGHITDQRTHQPLPGANVYLKNTLLGTSSQPDGTYLFNNLPEGKYTLVVSFLGYHTIQKEITVKEGIQTLSVQLKESASVLDEIVVTGTGTEHSLKEAPVQTEIISGKALTQYAGRNLEDLLGGLSASLSFNANDMGSNMQLNGLDNNYILILVNGKRINGEIGGQNDLGLIAPEQIERIEIVKGASSSLYGSDAIAGVINIITKKNKDKINVTNTSRVGYYGDFSQNNSIGLSNGRWNSLTSFNFKHTDGWRNTTEEWHRNRLYTNSVTKTINRSTHYNISENLSYQATNRLSFLVQASFYEKWTHRPTGVPQWRLYDFYYRNQSYSAEARYKLSEKDYLLLEASYDRYNYYYDYTQREYTDYFNEDGKRIVYYPDDRIMQTSQRRFLTQLKGVFHLGKANILNAGLEYNFEKLISPHRLIRDNATAYTLSAYAQDEWNPSRQLNITGGLRFVHHKEFGQTLTPKISALYKTQYLNFRATYAYGFKAPTIKELYYSYITTIMSKLKAYYGNTELKPQTSNYYSAGIEYHTGPLKASITGYYNQIRKMISLQTIATSPEDKMLEVEETKRYENLARARSFGADFIFSLDLNRNLSLGGGYSYVNAKSQNTDEEDQAGFMKYVPINGTSYHHATLRGNWNHAWKRYRLGVGVFGKYQSKRYYLTDGNAKGYQLWRINTLHSLLNLKKWKLDLNAGIDNIFDYVDRTPFGYNRGTTNPGRTYYVSVNIQFKNKP